MEHAKRRASQPPTPSRRTLRLTFEVRDGKLELVKQEHLQMITPPQVGERPEAGKHGGFWIELQDAKKRVIAHRVLNPTLLNSVEVHSPDGTIERHFGALREGFFEVLLPDDSKAKSAVLIGDRLDDTTQRTAMSHGSGSAELERFDLSARKGGD